MTEQAAQPADSTLVGVELKAKTARSVVWSVVRVSATTAATLVVFVVLARLLGPADFGTFALAALFVDIGRVLTFAGLGDAVTREAELDENFADSAFWATFALGLLVAAATFAVAPYYGQLVRDERVVEVLRWLSLSLPVASLGAIHNARLAREFGHKSLAFQGIVTGLVSGSIALAAAFMGWGVWALVVQSSVAALLGTALAWLFYRWRPGLRVDLGLLRPVFVFSFSMVLTQLMWMLLARVQDIFISRWHGPVEVGRYRVAWRIIELIGQVVLAPIGSVALVTLSRLQNNPVALRNAYNRFVGAAALGVFPIMAGFAVLAHELVPFVFGAQWESAADVSMVLSLIAVPFVMNYFAPPALSAINRAPTVVAVAALQLVATLILTWLFVPYGIVAVAVAYVLRAWLTMPYQQYVLRRFAGVEPMKTLGVLGLPLVASLVMAVTVWFAKPVIASELGNAWAIVAACVALGAGLYLLIIAIFGRRAIEPYTVIARSLLPSRN